MSLDSLSGTKVQRKEEGSCDRSRIPSYDEFRMKHLIVVAAALALLSACGKKEGTPPAPSSPGAPSGPRPEKMPNGEPAVITVEHVLIAFKDTGTKATRSKDEARNLAYEVLNRGKTGEDFTKLRKELSDDAPDGGV